jgi:hypothetical protein
MGAGGLTGALKRGLKALIGKTCCGGVMCDQSTSQDVHLVRASAAYHEPWRQRVPLQQEGRQHLQQAVDACWRLISFEFRCEV